MGRRPPKKPALCEALRGVAGARYRCLAELRPVAVVLAELRDFATRWRTIGVESWVSSPYALNAAGDVPFDDRYQASGASLLAHAADEDLPALALELEGGLCRRCAEEEEARRGHLRKLVFVGVVAGRTGRDDRAEEEFELARCAA